MNSTYELQLLARLIHKHSLEEAQERRFSRHLKRRATITSDEYRQFVVREERPCHC